jgi:glycosyltransferase involved in cell wall biosynthesis
MSEFLKFTFSIPTLNSAKNLERCLETIVSQDYPQDLIEIIIADAGSKDETLAIAKKYTDLIFDNKEKKIAEYGTQIAASKATGDLFVVFAADVGLVGKDWLKKVSAIFLKYPQLSCVWGKMIASPDDPRIMRYYELIQSEPLAQFLNRNLQFYLKRSVFEECEGIKFKVFDVDPKRPLCWGANGLVYRLKDVRDLYAREGYIGDNELFQYMVEKGRDQVAYSLGLNIYHHTVSSVRNWVSKWKRNYTRIFLKTRHERRIDWFYYGHFRLKMFFWLIYSLIPIFSILHSLYLMIRHRNVYWLYHPLMCFLQTATYIYWTLALPEGRKALLEHACGRSKGGACL